MKKNEERDRVLVKGFEDHAVGKAKALSTKALEDLGKKGIHKRMKK